MQKVKERTVVGEMSSLIWDPVAEFLANNRLSKWQMWYLFCLRLFCLLSFTVISLYTNLHNALITVTDILDQSYRWSIYAKMNKVLFIY